MSGFASQSRASIGPEDLSHLLAAVNEATSRLETSHAQLQQQVSRLTHDLGEANAQLERARRLAALGEMAAGIAHEIRNPLGCVRLYASMLEQDLSSVSPKQAAIAGKITKASKAMEAIVSDVLTFAKEFRLRLESVRAGDLFDRALEHCRHDGVKGWERVTIRRPDAGEVRCEGDAGLLVQALTNLIRNAVEAMDEATGASHTLSLESGERSAAGSDGRLVRCATFSVRDTGPGVSPEVVARMFNPFFTTRGAGTGLGLAIVHRIVDAHGGRVTVTNNETGPGACARIVIPLRAADAGVLGHGAQELQNRVQETAA